MGNVRYQSGEMMDEDDAYDLWRIRRDEEEQRHQPEMAPTAGVQVEVIEQRDVIEGALPDLSNKQGER